MFSKRENDDKGSKHYLKGIKFLPGGSRAEVKVETASADDSIGCKSLLRNCYDMYLGCSDMRTFLCVSI